MGRADSWPFQSSRKRLVSNLTATRVQSDSQTNIEHAGHMSKNGIALNAPYSSQNRYHPLVFDLLVRLSRLARQKTGAPDVGSRRAIRSGQADVSRNQGILPKMPVHALSRRTNSDAFQCPNRKAIGGHFLKKGFVIQPKTHPQRR